MTCGYRDRKKPELGLRRLFNPGDRFEIASAARLERIGNEWEVRATGDVRLRIGEAGAGLQRQADGNTWVDLLRDKDMWVVPCGSTPRGATRIRKKPG